jgi:alpha-glucosidase
MKFYIKMIRLLMVLMACHTVVRAQVLTVQSPNHKIKVRLFNRQDTKSGEWYLSTGYVANQKETTAIPEIDLGLVRNDQDFSKSLNLVKIGKAKLINESYTVLHGKKLLCQNSAQEVKVTLENSNRTKINIIIRAYNDGIAFRYEFPQVKGSFKITDELTSYNIPRETKRWMEKWNPANEGLYTAMSAEKVQKQEWCYPALFQTADASCWYLLHEADLNESYCGTKLSNVKDSTRYKLTFPNQGDGRGQGSSIPTIALPWKSPWRVIIMGGLQDIVASTLVDDVSAPSVVRNTGWIKPGRATMAPRTSQL